MDKMLCMGLLLAVSACGSGDKGTQDSGVPPTDPTTTTDTTATSTNTSTTSTSTTTGTSTTTTGTSTTTTTTTTTTTVMAPMGCDPTFCTWSVGTGAHGGDECTCVIDAAMHPTVDTVEGSCFTGQVGPDIGLAFDMTGYGGYTVTTCAGAPATWADSSLAIFDGDPALGGLEEQCNEDAVGETSYCAKVSDPGVPATPPDVVATPATGEIYVVMDEWNVGQVWDGVTDRTFVIEYMTVGPICGDGSLDAGETCDDGGNLNGDGCDEFCEFEPMEVLNCDPTYCGWSMGTGPNGGDVCSCTIPAASHPLLDVVTASCNPAFFASGPDVVFGFDTSAYGAFAASTCNATAQDSVLSVYDGASLANELVCNDNDLDSGSGCSTSFDIPGTDAGLVNTPAGNQMFFVVDEPFPGVYWDGASDRTIEFEFTAAPASVCGDGNREGGEECDDGGNVNGDGCDEFCVGEPVTLITDCDPDYCTWSTGSGLNGGDECTCVIPGGNHPDADNYEAGCFTGSPGADLVFDMDMTGYGGYTITTCAGNIGDSAMVVYDGDPATGGVEEACSEDPVSSGPDFCAVITDAGVLGADPSVTATPASERLFVVADEWNAGSYWNGTTPRTIVFEYLVDGPYCGDGNIDAGESCDDGANVNGDGCDEFCFYEPTIVTGCDLNYCTWSVGTGAHGGDVCSCTFSGADHPTTDAAAPSCEAFGGSNEVVFNFDTTGYGGFTASTCNSTADDSIIAAYDANPAANDDLVCVDNASAGAAGCSNLMDSATLVPELLNTPVGNDLFVVLEEGFSGTYWNGLSDRTIEFEFTVTPGSVCGDGTPESLEECDDGGNVNGDGCDEFCMLEPTCGNGYMDAGESCDDGNATPGDGCDAICQREIELGVCADVGPRVNATSGTLPCPTTSALLWDVYEINVTAGDCIDIYMDNDVAGADVSGIAVSASGAGYGRDFTQAQLEDETACTNPTWNGPFGCPEAQLIADADGTFTVGVTQWGDVGLPVPGCTPGAGYDLFVSVNGVEVLPVLTLDDSQY